LLAPLLLYFTRSLQNFFAAGEIMGGAIYLIENTPGQSKNLMSSLYGASTIAGILIASIAVSLLHAFDLVEQGWRILYFCGFLTAVCACIIRTKCSEITGAPVSLSWKNMFANMWQQRQNMLLIVFAAGFSYATYSMAFVLMNGIIPLISPISATTNLNLNTAMLVLDVLALPLFGLMTRYTSSEKLMLMASACAAVGGIPLFFLLNSASFLAIVIVRVCLVLIGVWFSATFYSWSHQLIPSPLRYSLISFAYAIGSQLIGSPTTSISLALFRLTQTPASLCWYWCFMAGVSACLFLRWMSEKAKTAGLSLN
jgi:MFS family permease